MAVNARTEKFQHLEVFDKPALFTTGRIARDTVPKGWYCYDIRGSDDDPGELCYMEENVVVNHAGSVLMPEKLAMPKSGRLDVRDELGFLDEGNMTLREFCEAHQLPYPAENMKFHIRPARPEEAGLFYTPHPEEDKRLGTVGHVRMDFGRSGNEFWHTWWPRGPEELNSPAFKLELQEVVDTLRESVLKNRFAKKVFAVYLAKEDVPNSEAYATLELPASPWELWDAMEKVRLKDGEALYMEIDDYYAFEYLAPHLEELDISLNELNDLAARLATLDEVQGIAFEGLFSMEVQKKVNTNGGIITMQDMRDLAVSAKTDCYHVVDAADDAQLGRFYAENDFVPELEGISDAVFEMLDFAGIGRMMRCSENGVFVNSLYVLRDGELTTAPPVQKTLPEKPGYLFRLTLGLHPDIGDDRTVTLILPAAEAELLDAQAQLGTEGWEGVAVIDYDGIIPYAAEFTDLPMELEEFNVLAAAVRGMPSPEKQLPKLKALLKQFEVQDIATAISLTECLDDYVLTPEISSPQETAIDQLHFMTDDHSVELLLSHVNLYAYGCDLIREDNAVLSPYGLLHRADYQPMLSPMQETQKMEMKMK